MKKILTLLSILCLVFVGFDNIDAEEDIKNNELGSSEIQYKESLESQLEREQREAAEMQLYDSDGNPVENVKVRKSRSVNVQRRIDSDYDATYGIVDFYSNRGDVNTKTVSYTNEETGEGGYIGGQYAREAAYLGKTSDGRIRFKMSGVTGVIVPGDTDKVAVYGDRSKLFTSFYRVDNDGYFYHYHIAVDHNSNLYYKTKVGYGKDVPYLNKDTNYYSYDGHYFYLGKDEHTMIDNYRAKTFKDAVNSNNPYFNYYQFLPLRSKTTITAEQFNVYTNKKVGSASSAMKDLGSQYIQQGHTYGVNPLSIYATSALESGWGKSAISLIKNNLFGHAAFDSSAFESAKKYDSPADSLAHHAKDFMSKSYLNPNNWVYNGGYLGDKNSGANVKYASDPWWGEKQAAILMEFNEELKASDYNKYKLGIKESEGVANIRTEPNTKIGKVLYATKNSSNMSFLVLEKVKGEYVNGSDIWYKIQCDGNVNSTRTALDTDSGNYNFDNSYAYIHSSNLTRVSGELEVTPPTPPITTYKKGDVNGDGKISSMDYVMVKNHILNIRTLTSDAVKVADINGDGKISSMDYVLIKNHILGISQIK